MCKKFGVSVFSLVSVSVVKLLCLLFVRLCILLMIIVFSLLKICGVLVYDSINISDLGVVNSICGGFLCCCCCLCDGVLLVCVFILIGRFIFLIGCNRFWWIFCVRVLSGDMYSVCKYLLFIFFNWCNMGKNFDRVLFVLVGVISSIDCWSNVLLNILDW